MITYVRSLSFVRQSVSLPWGQGAAFKPRGLCLAAWVQVRFRPEEGLLHSFRFRKSLWGVQKPLSFFGVALDSPHNGKHAECDVREHCYELDTRPFPRVCVCDLILRQFRVYGAVRN